MPTSKLKNCFESYQEIESSDIQDSCPFSRFKSYRKCISLVSKSLSRQTIQKNITRETFAQFSARVKKTMEEFSVETINNIIESMNKHIDMVLKVEGNRIRYWLVLTNLSSYICDIFMFKSFVRSKLFNNSFKFKCRKRLEHLTMARLKLNEKKNITVFLKSVFDTPGIMVIISRRGFVVPSYHWVTIQVTTKCNRFHPHTQECYHHELPSSYHTSYHMSYHSIYALFRAKVTSYYELLLIFLKKVIYIIFFKYFYSNSR